MMLALLLHARRVRRPPARAASGRLPATHGVTEAAFIHYRAIVIVSRSMPILGGLHIGTSAAPPDAATSHAAKLASRLLAAGSAIGSLRAGARCRSGTPSCEASRRSKTNSFPELPTLGSTFG